MIYNKKLPQKDNFNKLADKVKNYPASGNSVLKIAHKMGLNTATIDFVRLFPADVTFESRDDLLTRLEELKFLVEEERKMPEEHLRSPQD